MSTCRIVVNCVSVPVSFSSLSDFVNGLRHRFDCDSNSILITETTVDDDFITISWRVDGVLVAFLTRERG